MDKTLRRLFYASLFLSGFSALVYEVLWSRRMALVLGGDILAVSTVAATFMAGIALGSIAFGRLADRSRHPVRFYALIETGIGLSALAFPFCIDVLSDLLTTHPAAPAFTPGQLKAVLTLSSIVLLLIPSTLIGATLPVICRIFNREHFTEVIGPIYGLNLAGAFAGCLLTGFFLLPRFGTVLPNLLAVLLNLGIAALFGWRSRCEPSAGTTSRGGAASRLTSERLLLCGLIATTGCVAMGYEILWTRFFVLFLGTTSYAFAAVLGVFLLGLGFGAGLYNRLAAGEAPLNSDSRPVLEFIHQLGRNVAQDNIAALNAIRRQVPFAPPFQYR